MDQVHGDKPSDGYYSGNVTLMCERGSYPKFKHLVKQNLEKDIGTVIAVNLNDNEYETPNWQEVRVDKKYVDAKMKEYDKLYEKHQPKKVEKTPKKSSKKKS